jgi:chromosome segregation ATPase
MCEPSERARKKLIPVGDHVMASTVGTAPSRSPGQQWRDRIARIRALESRLAIAEVERDPFAMDDEQLVRVYRLEARIGELMADNDERLAVIRQLEAQAEQLKTQVKELTADNEERLAVIQGLTKQVEGLAADGEERLTLIHELTSKVTSLRAARSELEQAIAHDRTAIERVTSEAAEARAARQQLEALLAEQAQELATSRSGPRIRGLIGKLVGRER